MSRTIPKRKDVQFFGNHDNSLPLVIGGISLSLLGLLSFGLNRVLHALKTRKDVTVPRYNPRAMICAPASGLAIAPATAAPAKRREPTAAHTLLANHEHGDLPVPEMATSLTTVEGVFEFTGYIQAPALDDQVVYLDD